MEGLFSGLVSVCSLSVGVLKSAVGPLAAESIVSAQGTALARKSLASVLITSAVGGAASEAAEEIGHQLIIEARQPSRIDYRRVGVSAAFGTLIASGSTLAGASLNRLKEVRAAKKVEKAAKSAGNALPTERNLRYFAKDVVEGGRRTDFYVTPDGTVIPATGYRYISENASYLENMRNSMLIPANAEGTYFSFNNYDVANPGALQVPHDASIKVSFDTLQIIDDISVPYGNWGKGPHLEPIAQDFPQFGSGGATQVITHSEIKIDTIINLPKD